MSRRPVSPAARPGAPGGVRPARPQRARGRGEPAPESRPARLARTISVRTLVFGLVLLAAFTVLFPTVRAYLGQRAELDALSAEVAQAEADERALQRELDRWEDPAYVAAQARERLTYVMPGETAYRVIDPEVVVEPEAEPGTTAPGNGPSVPTGVATAPWYATVWESLEVAGTAGEADDAADGSGDAADAAGTEADR